MTRMTRTCGWCNTTFTFTKVRIKEDIIYFPEYKSGRSPFNFILPQANDWTGWIAYYLEIIRYIPCPCCKREAIIGLSNKRLI